MGKDNVVSTWRDIVNFGFKFEEFNYKADALFLDIPNPWDALVQVREVLRKSKYHLI